MDVPLSLSAPFDFDALQDFVLQRGAQTFDGLEPALLRRLLELFNGYNSEFSMKLEDFLGPQSGDAQQFERALRNLLSHRLECWMRASPVQLRDDFGDCLAYTRNLTEPLLRDH